VTATREWEAVRRQEATMKRVSILGWYRLLPSAPSVEVSQAIRYALWLAR